MPNVASSTSSPSGRYDLTDTWSAHSRNVWNWTEGQCALKWKPTTNELPIQEAEVAQGEEGSNRGAVVEEDKHLFSISTQTELSLC